LTSAWREWAADGRLRPGASRITPSGASPTSVAGPARKPGILCSASGRITDPVKPVARDRDRQGIAAPPSKRGRYRRGASPTSLPPRSPLSGLYRALSPPSRGGLPGRSGVNWTIGQGGYVKTRAAGPPARASAATKTASRFIAMNFLAWCTHQTDPQAAPCAPEDRKWIA